MSQKKNEFKRNQLWQILLLLAGNPFGIFEKSEIRKLLEIDKYVTHILQMMTMMMMRGTHHDNAGRGKGDVDRGDANGKKFDLEKLNLTNGPKISSNSAKRAHRTGLRDHQQVL